jgi:hypothetical protein
MKALPLVPRFCIRVKLALSLANQVLNYQRWCYNDSELTARGIAMPKRSPSSSAFYAILFATLLSCALGVVAQSGRRVRKSTPTPVEVPEPTPTPTKPAEKQKPAYTFIVGMDKYGDFSNIPLYVSSGVLRTFAGRLDDPESVKVEIATRDMGRSDSILRAKSEKEAYVVSLQLRSDSIGGSGSNSDPYNVEIGYAVFAPITAKQVTSGRTYPGAYRNKGVILSPKSPVYGDYALNQAAKDAAERILDHFHVGMVRP